MSFFYSPLPQFVDPNGEPFAGGNIYFGEPDVEPKDNPKAIWLNAGLTAPAANPQPLNTSGSPSQGTIYMNTGETYSWLLEDADGNQIENISSIIGTSLPADLNNIPAITINDSITIVGLTDSNVIIDSGVSPGATGDIEYQESTAAQWRWRRESIVDGGALVLQNVVQALARVIEVLPAGGLFLRYLGNERIELHATGMKLTGDITGAKQILVAGGTWLHDGSPQGIIIGMLTSIAVGDGEYTITLADFPAAEVDLIVNVVAHVAGVPYEAWGVGGANGSRTVDIRTALNNVPANVTDFTVQIFDAGRT